MPSFRTGTPLFLHVGEKFFFHFHPKYAIITDKPGKRIDELVKPSLKRQSNICTNLFFKVVNVREGEVTDSVVLKHLLDHLKLINYQNITDVYNEIHLLKISSY